MSLLIGMRSMSLEIRVVYNSVVFVYLKVHVWTAEIADFVCLFQLQL